MQYGKLVVICGPMFAGKTTYLIDGIITGHIGNVFCKNPKVYKHAHDFTRRNTEHIVSHSNKQYTAACLSHEPHG